MLQKKESEKPKVIEKLFERYEAGEIPEGIITSADVVHAIKATGAELGSANPANFLKDIVRSENANAIWPSSLKTKRITARQRYGAKRVLQFVTYAEWQEEPFPDRFRPKKETPDYSVQSASMSFLARRLGRKEETWLTQIVVNLRIVETQLSIFSPLRERVRDVTHLQMGMKTQPEIDAVYVASFGEDAKLKSLTNLHILISCEAKQLNQRILEDQIREQVAKAMDITKAIEAPRIDAVKPIAIAVVKHEFDSGSEKAIYVVEFRQIERAMFESDWRPASESDERLYSMPLDAVSEILYRVAPPIGGLNA